MATNSGLQAWLDANRKHKPNPNTTLSMSPKAKVNRNVSTRIADPSGDGEAKDDNTIEMNMGPNMKSMPNPKITAYQPINKAQNKEGSTPINNSTPLMKAAKAKRMASLRGGM